MKYESNVLLLPVTDLCAHIFVHIRMSKDQPMCEFVKLSAEPPGVLPNPMEAGFQSKELRL